MEKTINKKRITVLVEITHDTNKKIIAELAEMNREISKQSDGFTTKSAFLSKVINDLYEQQ